MQHPKIRYEHNDQAGFLSHLHEFLETSSGIAISKEEIDLSEDVADVVDLASVVSSVLPNYKDEAIVRSFNGSFLIEGISDETAQMLTLSLEDAGFHADLAGDIVLARRASARRSRAVSRSKSRARKTYRPAPSKQTAKPLAPAGRMKDDEEGTPLQLHVINDEWTTRAARRIFKDYVGSEDYRYFLQFMADIDGIVHKYQKKCGTNTSEKKEDEEEELPAKGGKSLPKKVLVASVEDQPATIEDADQLPKDVDSADEIVASEDDVSNLEASEPDAVDADEDVSVKQVAKEDKASISVQIPMDFLKSECQLGGLEFSVRAA